MEVGRQVGLCVCVCAHACVRASQREQTLAGSHDHSTQREWVVQLTDGRCQSNDIPVRLRRQARFLVLVWPQSTPARARPVSVGCPLPASTLANANA